MKKVTAYDYSKFESYSITPSPILKYCSPYCDDVLCLRFNSTYQVPSALTSRGLQVCFFIYLFDLIATISDNGYKTTLSL